MRYQLAIFDMDGTILDTIDDLANALNYALELHGFPTHPVSSVLHFVGNGMWKLIERGVPENTSETEIVKVHRDFMDYYDRHCLDNTKAYDGIDTLIKRLRSAGCKTAVVSNKADEAVHALCKQFFPGYFDVEIGAREGIANKPAPDSVYEVIRHFDMDKKFVVYIGDSDVDVATANNAGVDGIAVSWGFRSVSFLKEHGAGVILDSPKEVGDYICENDE